jgi:hypothetical protein
MGQKPSQPKPWHPPIPRTSLSTSYESSSEYIDEPSFTLHNIPVIKSISVDSLPATSKSAAAGNVHKSPTKSSSSITLSTPYFPLPASLVHEARQQYALGKGILWTLALHKLSPYFLHPVDLTSPEFIQLLSAEDPDAWITTHLAKFLHRVVSRRADAQRELKDAGIPYLPPRVNEMFELMNEVERRAFIGAFIREYNRRLELMARELNDAIGEDIITRDVAEACQLLSGDVDEDMEMLELERTRNLGLCSTEERGKMLRKRHSVFGSLRVAFSRHTGREGSGLSGESESSPQMATSGKSRSLSGKLGRSVRSIRHVFEPKSRGFKRAGIGEGVYVE